MLIEQNIEFELIGLVPLGRQIVLKLGIFMTKIKISQETFMLRTIHS